MYINNDDAEKDLIEQAIHEAELARDENIRNNFMTALAGLKAWFIATLDARKSKGNASPSSNAQLML